MALPTINENLSFTKTKLPSTKNIGVRGWRVKEEKELLFASERLENNVFEKARFIAGMLKSCVDDKDKFDLLSENDLKKIAIESRKISKGDEIEYNHICTNKDCGNVFEDVIKLSKSEKSKEFDTSPIKVNDNLIFAVKEVSLLKLIELQDRFHDEQAKLIFYYMINSIEAVTYEGVSYTEFTEDELIAFLDPMSLDLDKLYIEFNAKESKVTLEKKTKCKHCGKDSEVKIEDLLSFLIL